MFKLICQKPYNTAFIAVLLILTGCATTPLQTLQITVTDKGEILVREKRVSLKDVGRAVKKAGAKTNTMIKISAASNTSNTLCASIKKHIVKAGYPHIFFVRKMKPAAYVNEKNKKTKLKKPKPGIPRIKRR